MHWWFTLKAGGMKGSWTGDDIWTGGQFGFLQKLITTPSTMNALATGMNDATRGSMMSFSDWIRFAQNRRIKKYPVTGIGKGKYTKHTSSMNASDFQALPDTVFATVNQLHMASVKSGWGMWKAADLYGSKYPEDSHRSCNLRFSHP